MQVININETVTKLGANVIFTTDKPFENVHSIIRYTDEVVGLSNITRVSREFAVSYNGDEKAEDKIEWTPFYPMTDSNLSTLVDVSKEKIWFKFKYTITEKYDELPVTIKHIEIDIRFKDAPEIECKPENAIEIVDEIDTDINIEAIGEATVGLEQSMNKFINKSRGVEVEYWRTKPIEGERDHFLHEDSIHEILGNKPSCINIVLPENKLPTEETHNYEEWGIEWEEFVGHIDYQYFQDCFGRGEAPRDEDFMRIKFINRMYRVSSHYLERGTNGAPTYWVLNFMKYDYNTSVIGTDEAIETIKDDIDIEEEKFAEVLQDEFENATNNQQNSIKTIADDILRELVNSQMQIVDENIYNNGTILMKYYYDMRNIPSNEFAVKYKKSIKLPQGDSWGHSCWINIPTVDEPTASLNVTGQTRLDYNRVQITFDREIKLIRISEGDSIHSMGEVYDIDEIVDDYNIILRTRNDLTVMTNYKKSRKVNILFASNDDSDLSMDIYNQDLLRIRLNNKIWDFTGLAVSKDTWYGYSINISNTHSYFDINVWEREDRSMAVGDEKYSTRLVQHYTKVEPMTTANCIVLPENTYPAIMGSEALMSTIRSWRKAVPQDDQSFLLSTDDVKKPAMAWIIDDADIILNLGVVGRGNTYITEIEKRKEENK